MHIYHWFHFDGLNDEFSFTFICSQTASLANWQVKVGWCSHKPASAATEAEANAFNIQDTHNKSRNAILEWTCIHCVYTIIQLHRYVAQILQIILLTTTTYSPALITSQCIVIVWIIRKTLKHFSHVEIGKPIDIERTCDGFWADLWRKSNYLT